jgi:hypothetical protein
MIMKIGAALLPEHWQATADELAARYPCDRLAKTDVRALTRAVDIEASAPVTFRWLCQLRVAPIRKQLITLKQLAEQTAQKAAIEHAQRPKRA